MENSIKEDIKLLREMKNNCLNRFEYYTDPKAREKAEAIEHILSDYKRVLKENKELKQDRNNNYQMIALAQNEMLGYMQGYEDGKKLKRSAVACVVENQQYYIFNKQIEHYKEYIVKLRKENEKLKNIRYDTPYGTETIHLIPKSDLIEINTQKYMIEVEPGKFVDLKQVYQENKKLNEYKENYIPKSKVKEKIEELDKRIDFLNTELTKCYIEREKLGTETDIDNNEAYIFYMEEEKNFREKQEEVLQELLREE